VSDYYFSFGSLTPEQEADCLRRARIARLERLARKEAELERVVDGIYGAADAECRKLLGVSVTALREALEQLERLKAASGMLAETRSEAACLGALLAKSADGI
jgi:hypothetical protein